jgi:hypothetical protein
MQRINELQILTITFKLNCSNFVVSAFITCDMQWKGRAYSAAKSTGLGLAEKEEATNADVLGIGIGCHRLKQAAEELSI